MTDVSISTPDHSALLARCAGGDRAALEALYVAEAPRMTGVARRILKRADVAEEAVQEAFVRIWRKAHQYDPQRGSALGWIYSVQRSVALNVLRDAQREDPAEPRAIENEIDRRAELVVAEELWRRLDRSSRLRACLETLDPVRRTTVLLAYAHGLTHGEIAGRLVRPIGTVKAWLRRSLTALRECME